MFPLPMSSIARAELEGFWAKVALIKIDSRVSCFMFLHIQFLLEHLRTEPAWEIPLEFVSEADVRPKSAAGLRPMSTILAHVFLFLSVLRLNVRLQLLLVLHRVAANEASDPRSFLAVNQRDVLLQVSLGSQLLRANLADEHWTVRVVDFDDVAIQLGLIGEHQRALRAVEAVAPFDNFSLFVSPRMDEQLLPGAHNVRADFANELLGLVAVLPSHVIVEQARISKRMVTLEALESPRFNWVGLHMDSEVSNQAHRGSAPLAARFACVERLAR